MAAKKKLGQILLDAELLDEYQLKSALGYQQKWGGRLGDVLVENHFITEEALLVGIQQQTGISLVKLEGRTIPDYLKKLIPLEVAEKHKLVPIGLDGEYGKQSDTLVIAMSDPTDLNALDEIRFLTGKRVNPVLAAPREIDSIISLQYRGSVPVPMDGSDIGSAAAGLESSAVSEIELEMTPQAGAKTPSSAGMHGDDPFAELDSLASFASNEVPIASERGQKNESPGLLDGDPFSELDALSSLGISGNESIEIDLDQVDDDLEELEIIEDVEIIDELQNMQDPPAQPSVPAAEAEQIYPPSAMAAKNLDSAAPERTPLDDLPDLGGISLDEPMTPPEMTQAPNTQDDPFLDGADLDLDGVLGVLTPDDTVPAQGGDAAVSSVTTSPTDEKGNQTHQEDVTERADLQNVKNSVPFSEQKTAIVQMPVALEPQGTAGAEHAVGQPLEEQQVKEQLVDAEAQMGEEKADTTIQDESVGSAESDSGSNPEQSDAIKSSAMKELLSRVGLRNGQASRQDASPSKPKTGISEKSASRMAEKRDGQLLSALIRVLVDKGIITEEELQKAKDRS